MIWRHQGAYVGPTGQTSTRKAPVICSLAGTLHAACGGMSDPAAIEEWWTTAVACSVEACVRAPSQVILRYYPGIISGRVVEGRDMQGRGRSSRYDTSRLSTYVRTKCSSRRGRCRGWRQRPGSRPRRTGTWAPACRTCSSSSSSSSVQFSLRGAVTKQKQVFKFRFSSFATSSFCLSSSSKAGHHYCAKKTAAVLC